MSETPINTPLCLDQVGLCWDDIDFCWGDTWIIVVDVEDSEAVSGGLAPSQGEKRIIEKDEDRDFIIKLLVKSIEGEDYTYVKSSNQNEITLISNKVKSELSEHFKYKIKSIKIIR